MKLFIAWSGNSSKRVAQSLHEWLPSVLPYVKPWMSEEDIGKGTIWNAELWKNLKTADFGILCLVPENITEHWVIFEAGALSGGRAYDKVSPFLLGIEPEDLPVPLRQFQCTRFRINDVRKLILRLNELAKEDERLDEQELKKLFQAQWSKLRKRLNSIDLTQSEEETENASEENNQSETREEQLDNIHIDILKTIASSPLPSSNLIYLQAQLQINQRLIIIKLNDLIKKGYVKRVGSHGYPEIVIEDKGVRFLHSEGLL
jgi:predicted transcriptional regulator